MSLCPPRHAAEPRHKLYYVVLSLARFNLYANSYGYLTGPKPKHDNLWRFELAGVAFYWLYFGSILLSLSSWQMRLAYLLVSHVVASPVHVQVSCTTSSSLTLDCTLSFRLLHRGSGASRVLSLTSVTDYDGRDLLSGHRVYPWWFAFASHPSSLPSTASS